MTIADYDREPRLVDLRSEPGLKRRLDAIWETKPGVIGWFASVDHKSIGIRYLVTAFVFLVIGGIEALIMRLQLAGPDKTLLTPEQYNELFTLHGLTMIFLYALPVLSGFSNYLFPLVLGARDMAFPRLNAFSYWVYLAAGLFMYTSLLMAAAPNDGWFNYAPYAEKAYDPGPNIDFYALGMIFYGVSTTVGAANFLVTFLRMRAPGMSIDRVPILTWGTVTISVGNLLAVPSVSLAFLLLWMDRQFGAHFFTPSGGGQPLLWQHLFWMFAHPWVYVVVLPAMGLVSDALPFFCRRPLVGYVPVVIGTITTMILGFGVWLHHMFATGIPFVALAFFSGASFIITIPSAIAVFGWIATIWTGRPVVTTAFLYFVGFISMFVIGGVSGVMTAAVAADLQLTETYFVVAHLHYVLIGINLFAVMGALFVWFPKMTGRMLDEVWGKRTFWLVFAGFNIAFFPMHLTGLLGMPRRIYTYPADVGWSTVNLITTIGSFILAFGILLYLVNIVRALRNGTPAGPNPWDAASLEWSVASPPPPYNFAVIPYVTGREPLWRSRLGDDSLTFQPQEGLELANGKEALVTTAIEAEPVAIVKMPDDTLAPFVVTVAMTVGFAAALAQVWWLAGVGVLATALGVLVWLWPDAKLAQTATPEPGGQSVGVGPRYRELPVGSIGRHANGFWGALTLIATEAALFSYLLFSYYYVAVQHGRDWLPEKLPEFKLSAPDTALLIASSFVVARGEKLIRRRGRGAAPWLLGGAVMGAVFVAVQIWEWSKKDFSFATSSYGSLYYTITGFHLMHVVVGVLVLLTLAWWSARGYFGERRNAAVTAGALYWHFVDIVWIFLFTTFYITPYLGVG